MKRDTFTLPLAFPGELIIDNFAGGGGTSEGLEIAFGRPVDIAINHDPEALAMHALNHPYTHHLCESVWDVKPNVVTRNQPVGLVWLSPDCKHFSKAKGSTPVEKSIRGLAWVGMRWVALTKPRVLMLENVEEFQDWGPLISYEYDGKDELGDPCRLTGWKPDPAKKGHTFKSFVRQLRGHGYVADWKEMRACDNGAPTIRKRLFLQARRDGIAIEWPDQTHGNPISAQVIAAKLLPWRTAAECIDFSLPSNSIFDRKKPLVVNTQRRVAKGLWRHVLTSAKPFIVGQGGPVYSGKPVPVDAPVGTIQTTNHRGVVQPVLAPFISEHANGSNQRNMPADEPLRTQCAEVKGGHFSMVAPTLIPLRGTSEAHLGGHSVEQPVSTISAGGTHHGMVGAHLITIGYGEREGQPARAQDLENPLGTVVSANKHAIVAAHLVDMGHGESSATGAKRWSHGHRDVRTPLNAITASGGTAAISAVHLTHLTHHGERAGMTPDGPLPTVTGAHRGEQCLVTACLEQANGGFYEGDGRAADAPISTITSSGSNQRLVMAYYVKYYSSGGQDGPLGTPMHTVPTKGRMGLVECLQVPVDCLAPEHRARAAQCAALLHEHLPEHFPELASMVLVWHESQYWVLVDITLRMLKPPELFQAQGFRKSYIIHEIPDPKLLFVDGKQVPGDPRLLPRIPLSVTAQIRMCGNSVSPKQAEALARTSFKHEAQIYGMAA
jgi:DNA (cytosine-5)-methyltransferase 1